MVFLNGSGISLTVCKQSAPHSRQITTPTHHQSISTGWMLFLMPNQQCQSTERQVPASCEVYGICVIASDVAVHSQYCSNYCYYWLFLCLDREWSLMKIIIAFIFCCDNLCKSKFTALENSGNFLLLCGHLRCFDAVGWAAGRASSLQKTRVVPNKGPFNGCVLWASSAVVSLLDDLRCIGESDAQTAVAVPQRDRFILLRQSGGSRRDVETVQHQTKDSQLRATFVARGSSVNQLPTGPAIFLSVLNDENLPFSMCSLVARQLSG